MATNDIQKIVLLKRISKIHADNCDQTANYNLALESFDRLESLKKHVKSAKDKTQLQIISNQIDEWENE